MFSGFSGSFLNKRVQKSDRFLEPGAYTMVRLERNSSVESKRAVCSSSGVSFFECIPSSGRWSVTSRKFCTDNKCTRNRRCAHLVAKHSPLVGEYRLSVGEATLQATDTILLPWVSTAAMPSLDQSTHKAVSSLEGSKE